MTDINEDLRKWFKEKWVRFDTKGNIKGDCAKEPGEGKPKCLPMAKAHALGKEERASAARRKRGQDPHADREGKAKFVKTVKEENINEIKNVVRAALIHGRQVRREMGVLAKNPNMTRAQKIKYAITRAGMEGHKAAETIWDYPMNITTPAQGALYAAAGALGGSALKISGLTKRLNKREKRKMNEEVLLEKNVPTNPKLWAQAKALAKKKFKIYPSAYANGWAAKWYKSKGGGWKSLNEDYEHEMARNELRTAMRGIERLMKHLDGEGELEAWVQSKLTKAADYIDTLADYMDSRDSTVKEAYEIIEEAKKKMDKKIPQTIQNMTPGSNPYADDSNCPTYVTTPGQPITEAKGPKTPIGFQRAAQKAVAGGLKGKKRRVAKEIARASAEEIKRRKAAETAELYPGPKKTEKPKSKPTTPAKQMVPPMKGGTTPSERIATAFNRPGYTSKPNEPSPMEKTSTEPDTFEAYLHHIGKTGERLNRRRAKNLIHRDYTRLLTAALGTDHPALKAHAIETAEQYKKDSIRTYREIVGSPVHKLLKAIGLREEHGAGDTGTTEVTNKYIEHTPGQLPLSSTKVKKTIKKVVKEEVLNEIRGEKKAIGIRRPYTARRTPGRKVKLNLARSRKFRALGTRGPVAPKRSRPGTTVSSALTHAAKFTRQATRNRIKRQREEIRNRRARDTLIRAARG